MIYLDSAATTYQKPPAVFRAVRGAMASMTSPGRGTYGPAARASRTLLACREEAAALFHVPSPEQVVFTFNATQLEGITVLDDTEKVTVRVVVPSDYTSKDIDVSAAGVKLNNVPAGYTAKVTALNSDSVTIIGPKSAIRGLKAKNVMLSCDLTAKKGESIKTGTRQLPVTVSIAKADGTWAYGTYRATVELSKK